jgi:AraC-like DNA-binding protein
MDELPNWEFYILQTVTESREQIERHIREKEIHFLVYESELTPAAATILSKFQHQYPFLSIIYYNSLLRDGEFNELHQAGISHCIIGESKEKNLIETLHRLWATHWKRIPNNIFESASKPLSGRAIHILRTIENKPLRECNTCSLAQSLDISESHFRKEFKRYFRINFREFKKRLLSHYESILLFDKKLKPGDVFSILDYKNISAFSRSFKMRHGYSWQVMVRENN